MLEGQIELGVIENSLGVVWTLWATYFESTFPFPSIFLLYLMKYVFCFVCLFLAYVCTSASEEAKYLTTFQASWKRDVM